MKHLVCSISCYLTSQADTSGKGAATQQKKQQEEHPDLGLSGSHELVKFLGRGGTGDTWLFNDRATGEEVAIKLVKRPVPKVIQPNLLREIRVSSVCLTSVKYASQQTMTEAASSILSSTRPFNNSAARSA